MQNFTPYDISKISVCWTNLNQTYGPKSSENEH